LYFLDNILKKKFNQEKLPTPGKFALEIFIVFFIFIIL